ncbi:MAG TPA: hypothetical protein VFV50_09140 [Bdellovibrionales bacterium]|nr:hypothetical protein [Bdellovibrionales bacterium]
MKLKISVFALALALTSCGEDKDMDSYKREKLAEDMAKIQTAAGDYGGYIWAADSDKPIASVKMTLTASTKQSGSTGEQVPVLNGSLAIQGTEGNLLTFKNASFDAENGSFVVTFPAELLSEQVELNLTGGIHSGVFEGRLEAGGFSESAGRIRVVKGVEAPVKPTNVIDAKDSPIYVGKMKLVEIQDVYLKIDGRTSPVQQIINRLRPVKYVTATLDFCESITIFFPVAKRDMRNGQLYAEVKIPQSDEGGYTLTCRESTTQVCDLYGHRKGHMAKIDFKEVGSVKCENRN